MRMLLAVVVLSFISAPVQAQSQRWVATSNTAMSITGDITVAPDSVTFSGGRSLKLEKVADGVYRVTPPSDPKLLRGNTLCGAPVTYLTLVTRDSGDLEMKVYSGDTQPVANGDGGNMCASYYYTRP